MNNIELYINEYKVDLSESTKILFTYAIKDVYNPTIVKNSFSKSVVLVGTKNNNKVFNNLWNLDVAYSMDVQSNFNSSKRNAFTLYWNGEIIESGYIKLDSIRNNNGSIEYSCTMYGGIGDFLYSLMYDDAGNKKTLASLNYLEGGEDELDFTINADAVYDAWQKLNPEVSTGSSIWDVINFVPCYNGASDTIDSNKVLINTNGATVPVRKWNGTTWETVNNFPTSLEGGYSLYNGYALAELPIKMNEWQVRDLRSYMQRPAISIKSIVNACCNPNNNGGYEVELDTDFFNSTNPYYENCWLTLPLMNDMKGKSGTTTQDIEVWVKDKPQITYNEYQKTFFVYTNSIIPASTQKVDLDLDLKLKRTHFNGWVDVTSTTVYTSAYIGSTPYYGGVAVQLLAVDAAGNTIAGSDVLWLTSYVDNASDYLYASEAGVSNQWGNVTTHIGNFERDGQTEFWQWPETLHFSLVSNSIAISQLRLVIVQKQRGISGGRGQNALYDAKHLDEDTFLNHYIKFDYEGTNTFSDLGCTLTFGGENSNIYSNTPVGKKTLLTTEHSPADYLLSYTKLFNLYYEKDPYEKKIKICTMKNYYDGKRIDLDNLIDRSMDIKITPLSFDTNTYEMKYNDGDLSDAADRYVSVYGEQFGSERIATGYEFDAERKQIYDGKLNNAITVLEDSPFYVNIGVTPAFLSQTVTYKLFNNSGDSSEVNLTRANGLVSLPLNAESYDAVTDIKSPFYDVFEKVQFHKNNEPIDGKDVLVMFNGFRSPYIVDGSAAKYILSDDVQEMIDKNGKPCYLWSDSTVNTRGVTICKFVSNFPQFGRYITVNSINSIMNSLDIGRTKELFVPSLRYVDGGKTIYETYWSKYLEDLYDINTRIVECSVRFPEKVMQNNLKHYYYFDGCYWVISQITDYNPLSEDTVQCKFVKVNDFGVYSNYDPTVLPEGVIVLTLNNYTVPASGGTLTGYVWVNEGESWHFDSNTDLDTSITGATGSASFTVTVPPNTGSSEVYHSLSAINSYSAYVLVRQLSINSDITFTVTDDIVGNIPYSGGLVAYSIRSTYPWSASTDNPYIVFETRPSGSGNTDDGESLTVRVTQNRTLSARTATILFETPYGQYTEKNITQDGDTGLSVTPSSLSYEQSGGTQYISINVADEEQDNRYWRLLEIPEWISYSQMQGSGDAIVGLTAEANESTSARSATINAYDATSRIAHNISVTQEGQVPERSLTVTPSAITTDYSAKTITVELNYVGMGSDFIIPSVSGLFVSVGEISFTGETANVDIIILENLALRERQATVTFSGAYASATLTITQGEGVPYIDVSPSTIGFDSGTDLTRTLTINSNETWEII